MKNNIKILLSKPGLDGHDVGVKVLAHALKDGGFKVFYTGLRKSIEDIVLMAKEKSVDVIGLSILSGTHLILCEKMQKEMQKNDQKSQKRAVKRNTRVITAPKVPSGFSLTSLTKNSANAPRLFSSIAVSLVLSISPYV